MRGWATLSLLTAGLLLMGASEPSKARVHGYSASGTILSVDQAAKSFVLKTPSGRQIRLSWTDATVVVGGAIGVGQRVTLRYLDRDRKHIATSIRIGPPSTPAVAAAGAATPAPVSTPSSR